MKRDYGVVIIARDEEHNIEGCISAIVGSGIEDPLVIVDERSSDGTAECARKYSLNVMEAHGNRGKLRNLGYEKTGLPFVAYVDADMRISPGYLETLRENMELDTRLAIVCGMQTPYNCGLLGSLECEYWNYLQATGSGGAMYRSAALENVGGFNSGLNVGEDGDLLLRLLEAGWKKKWIKEAVIAHKHADKSRTWFKKMTYGSAAGFNLHGMLRFGLSPVIGLHASLVRRKPNLSWYVVLRSLALLVGKGEKKEYSPSALRRDG